jgi:ribosome-binding ATPase YchF (GTP1/OBG family)
MLMRLLCIQEINFPDILKEAVKNEKAEVIIMNNNIEAQIAEMESADDKQLFMEEYKMTEPALDRLIHSAYKLLNLFTYFTAGVQEVRAWTIHQAGKLLRQPVLFIQILKKDL